MNTTNTFDELTRRIGTTTTRRQAIKALAAGVGAALIGGIGLKPSRALAITATQFRDAKCEYLVAWHEARGIDPYGDGVDFQEWMVKHRAHPHDGVDAPATRYRQNSFTCGENKTVLDGLIMNGPQQDASGLVDIDLVDGEAVDSCDPNTTGCRAVYSEEPRRIGQNTLRATKGTVTGDTWTYYVVDDEAFVAALEDGKTPTPPDPKTDDTAGEGGDASGAAATGGDDDKPDPKEEDGDVPDIGCVDSFEDLATALGDGVTYVEVADGTYGGGRFELKEDVVLPVGYEAIGPGGISISENTSGADARTMTAGFWSIYFPRGTCRSDKGYQD